MKLLLQTVDKVGVPKTDEENELIKKCIEAYDDIVKKLEKEFLSRYRNTIN